MRNEQRGILASRENCTATGFRKQVIFDLDEKNGRFLPSRCHPMVGLWNKYRSPVTVTRMRGEKISATTPRPTGKKVHLARRLDVDVQRLDDDVARGLRGSVGVRT